LPGLGGKLWTQHRAEKYSQLDAGIRLKNRDRRRKEKKLGKDVEKDIWRVEERAWWGTIAEEPIFREENSGEEEWRKNASKERKRQNQESG